MKKFKLEFLKNGEDQEDYYVKSTDGRPYKIQWQKPHETVSRELWKNNTLGKNYQSARHRKDSYNDSNKKHHSLPVPSKKKVEEKPRQREIVVDPRRFGMVDPFTFSGKNFTMDNSALDFASYFAQEIQKEEEKRKQRESVDSSIKSVNSTNSTDSVGETTNKGIIRSRRESLQSMRQDSRTSRRESLQSMRQDSLHESQQPVIQDNRTSRRESQQSFRRDSRASHQETNVERFQNILPSTPEHEETDTSSLISISNKPPLPKKSSSRFRESKVPGTCLTCRGKIAEGGDWLCKAHNVPNSEIAMQFSEAEQRRLESIKQGTKSSSTPEQIESPVHSPTTYSSFNNIGENVHSEAAFKSRYLKFESLQEPTIIFTRTYHAREHLALQEYLTAETEAYNAKYEAIQADNTEIAAEIYEIMQYL
ncbi:1700_t:CDS:2 [Rhizophagus irregularis]|nr:1700_t:CDS:2 [Rhizophagus irregularis]